MLSFESVVERAAEVICVCRVTTFLEFLKSQKCQGILWRSAKGSGGISDCDTLAICIVQPTCSLFEMYSFCVSDVQHFELILVSSWNETNSLSRVEFLLESSDSYFCLESGNPVYVCASRLLCVRPIKHWDSVQLASPRSHPQRSFCRAVPLSSIGHHNFFSVWRINENGPFAEA